MIVFRRAASNIGAVHWLMAMNKCLHCVLVCSNGEGGALFAPRGGGAERAHKCTSHDFICFHKP